MFRDFGRRLQRDLKRVVDARLRLRQELSGGRIKVGTGRGVGGRAILPQLTWCSPPHGARTEDSAVFGAGSERCPSPPEPHCEVTGRGCC